MSELKITPIIEIPEHLVEQIQAKMAYVDEKIGGATIAADGSEITIVLRKNTSEAQSARIEEKVQSVVEEMAKGSFKPKVEVLEDYRDRPMSYDKDPMGELLATREVIEEATGMFTFGPTFTRLVNYFESRFLELADHFDAAPYRFPALMSAEKLARVEYFQAFPHSLTFATHIREDLDVISEFAENTKYEEGGLNTPMESFSKIQAMLSPAVCYHLYFTLADAQLPTENITATAVGTCFRYESTNLTSLQRLWNFTMREVIFVGSKEFVLERREQSRKFMHRIFEEVGLVYHVETANDPFFVGEFRKQAMFQNAFQLKYEIRGLLPFKNDDMAVGSYNYHQDFFGRNLNITLADGSPIHTGCTAFGLERMVYAFIAQHSLDPKNWPSAVREALQ